MRRLAPILAALWAATASASAETTEERVIAALSQNAVGITATFSGSEIFVFGAVERNRLADERDDGLDVVIAVTGPSEPVVLRKKDRRFGIWV
ncbi:MAG: TIGR02186 family protein, partial [Pseudomonadota bacterium]